MLCRAIVIGKSYIGEFETNGFDVTAGSYVEVFTKSGKRDAIVIDFNVKEDVHIIKYCPVVAIKSYADYLVPYAMFFEVYDSYKEGLLAVDECITILKYME